MMSTGSVHSALVQSSFTTVAARLRAKYILCTVWGEKKVSFSATILLLLFVILVVIKALFEIDDV